MRAKLKPELRLVARQQQAFASLASNDRGGAPVEGHECFSAQSAAFELDNTISEITASLQEGKSGLNGITIAGDSCIIDKLTH